MTSNFGVGDAQEELRVITSKITMEEVKIMSNSLKNNRVASL